MIQRARANKASGTHKTRSAWFQESTAWPFRELGADELLPLHARSFQPATQPLWDSVGPRNVAGRMTSVVAHPKDPENVLAGAAGGGVWHRPGPRGPWSAASQGLASLNVGALALDAAVPAQPVVYCGTGEANLSADGHPGAGLYKSTDWGNSWSVVATPTRDRIPGRIGAIAVDPGNPKHLLLGGVGHRSDERDASGGLFLSEDGGGTWTLVTDISPAPYWCHSVVFGTDRTLFAAITARGAQSGIWIRGTDKVWYHAWDGLPSPETFHRTSIAVSRSDPRWVYALAADRFGGVLGVFQSRDSGSSWREIGHDHFRNERTMRYNNAIAVHPTKKDHVLCGGVELHLWDGVEWLQVTSWHAKHSQPHLPHADHHCLSMPDGDLVYDMNDGGMAVSTDGGRNWEDRSRGLVTTMFYDLDVAPNDATARTMGGGTQDNGTLVTPDGPDDFRDVTGGDGGWMAFDPTPAKEKRFFSTVYGVEVYLHHDFPDGWREEVFPPEEQWVRDTVFLSPLQLEPRSGSVYLGTIGIWRGDPAPKREVSWLRLADSLDGSAVTALEVAPADPKVVYAGTENGGLFVSRDRGASWSGDLSSRVLPGAMITRIRTLPSSAAELVVCVGRVGHGHVFRSRNWGIFWEDVNGKLPDVPFRALAVDPQRSGVVYAGSDNDVFVSEDFGDRWWSFTGSLPNVAVTDLVIHEGTRRLFAATYGRGISVHRPARGGWHGLPAGGEVTGGRIVGTEGIDL